MKRPRMEALQLERLKWMVRFCYENVPLYHQRMEEAGVTPDKMKTLADIRHIPLPTSPTCGIPIPSAFSACP